MIARAGVALCALAALAGCAGLERDAVQDRESRLSAAGFAVLPANTQRRQDLMATLPPNRVSQIIRGQTVSYVYPDPVLCHCLYAGGQRAFARYSAYVQQRQIANEQLTAAQMNYDGNWDWGPWGGYGGWE